jgi:hypothetical protein
MVLPKPFRWYRGNHQDGTEGTILMVLQNHSVCIGGIIQMVFGMLSGMFSGKDRQG